MKFQKAQLFFDAGRLLSAEIVPAPMGAGWLMQLRDRDGGQSVLERTRSAHHKEYKTLEAAARDARRIGFQVVTVQLGAAFNQ